jgi:hypothetical protein
MLGEGFVPSAAARLRSWLSSPRVAPVSVALACVLGLAALGNGIVADDLWHRASLGGAPPGLAIFQRRWWELFTFFHAPSELRSLRDVGFAPWWVDERASAVFLRPLSGATHAIDYALWPSSPACMHAQSVLWYAALVALAAWVYRRVLRATPLAAGLATLLYALDPNHGIPVGWLANRNALVAGALALASLGAFDRAARAAGAGAGADGRRAAAWSIASAALLAFGLLGGESAVSVLGYLAAYAIFLDERPPRARLAALVPHALVTVAWAIAYRTGGYGVRWSGMYHDPVRDPALFAEDVAVHLPLLVASELGLPPPDLFAFLPAAAKAAFVGAALACAGLASCALARLWRADPRARFLLAGGVLAAVPSCATFPSGRLLVLSGFGLVGGVALACAGVLERAPWTASGGEERRGALTGRWSRAATRAFVGWAGAARLAISPLALVAVLVSVGQFNALIGRLARALPADDGGRTRRVVLVTSPDTIFVAYALMTRIFEEPTLGYRLLTLAGGARRVTLRRADDRTLLVTVDGGLYRRGTELLMRRPDAPMPAGTRVALTGVAIDVRHALADGVPDEIAFRFDAPLDSPALAWRAWDGRTLVPIAPPRAGETVVLEPHLP